MLPEPSGLYYPGRLARAFFVAMDDVMGKHGLSALVGFADLPQYASELPVDTLAKTFDFSDISALNSALEEMYGQRGGRGMAMRIGSAAFVQGFKNFGVMRGIGDPAFRALPLEKRTELGLRSLANVLTHFTDQQSALTTEGTNFVFSSIYCPFAWGRTSDKPVCHAMVGILQECLRWASNGYEFSVREVSCRACGDPECMFRIARHPIGENR